MKETPSYATATRVQAPARLLLADGSVAGTLDPTRAEHVIGRDASSVDVAIVSPAVSRRHAIVHTTGSGHDLEDIGSANGTTLNGRPLAGRVSLTPGDEICFGGDISVVYARTGAPARAAPRRDATRSLAWSVAGILAVAAIAGAVATGYVRVPWNDPLERAAALAAAGVAESRAGRSVEAKASLRAAVALLYREGLLDDAEPGQGASAAFALIETRMEEPADLREIFERTVESSRPALPETETSTCRLDLAEIEELEPCLREHVDALLVELRQSPSDVPPWFYRRVGTHLRSMRGFLGRTIPRGAQIVPMMREELVAARMPPALHYLALIESGYRADAISTAGAVGLWQFMPETARQYALAVSAGKDERTDPRKSTRAAAQYLRDLTFEFGGDALLLALAGYNRGENGVRRALKRLDDPFSDRSLWALVERGLLPEETADYVPRFMAAAVADRGGIPDEPTLIAAGF